MAMGPMITTKGLAVLSLALCFACTLRVADGVTDQGSAPLIRIEVIDRPSEKRFVVTLRSKDKRPLCLGIDQWPNRSGQLDTGSKRARLESAAGTFPARDENFGFCVGEECVIHVAPGASLTGFIGYAEFGPPAKIAALPRRRLHFPVTTWVCTARQ